MLVEGGLGRLNKHATEVPSAALLNQLIVIQIQEQLFSRGDGDGGIRQVVPLKMTWCRDLRVSLPKYTK